MQKKITVLVCDDSAVIRKIIGSYIEQAEDMELVGIATDPFDAREKIKQLNPDVLTLDIEMPLMNGLTFLEKIMTLRPMPVIMVSTLTQRGAAATLQALESGAYDYLGKPDAAQGGLSSDAFHQELLLKIRAAAASRIVERFRNRSQQASGPLAYRPPVQAAFDLIAIGASTGGVEALRDVFQQLPGNLPPIVLTQHMPRTFSESFAARLNSVSALEVHLAKNGDVLKTGHAYVATGSQHLMVVKRGENYVAHVREGVPVSGHCPSVDVLFESVTNAAGNKCMGVILTGMGKDGAAGMLSMHKSGGFTIGQNEESCVVYGMPKAALLLGGVGEQLPLNKIPARIVAACESNGAQHAC